MQVHSSESEHEADEAGETLHKDNLVIAVLGPPGTGKTTLTHGIVQWVQDQGGRISLSMPTNVSTARVKKRYRNAIDIGTCHSAFGFDEEVPPEEGHKFFDAPQKQTRSTDLTADHMKTFVNFLTTHGEDLHTHSVVLAEVATRLFQFATNMIEVQSL